jgi:hypothetical protein
MIMCMHCHCTASNAAASALCSLALQGLMERFQKKGGGFLGLDFSGLFGNK